MSTGASASGPGSRPSDGAASVSTLTGFDPSRMTPPNIWGGGGFEVHDALGDDGEVEMGAMPRWHVMVNGVGSWPVAYFYLEGDAELWSRTMNAFYAQGIDAGTGETAKTGSTRRAKARSPEGDASAPRPLNPDVPRSRP